MSDTVECPADGCDYTGVKRSVASHYSGKRDDRHSGGFATAKLKLDDASDKEPSEQSRSNESGGASDSEGLGIPESEKSNSGQSEQSVECPSCGSELADAEGVYRLKDGTRVAADAADKWCPSCEGIVTPDGEVII
jgi:hypothetical protein